AWWWPTALGGPAIFRPWARTLEPLVRSWAQPMEAALPLVTPRAGHALPLWDGPYLLVPHTAAGGGLEAALPAFAAAALSADTLDLVVLGDPDAAVEQRARQLGIGTRVHFAGPAARGAEWPWVAYA